jgi:Ca2+-binding EF-hand superfamily protein
MSASSSAASSSLSRSNAAVLFLTTIAAAYGVYYLHSNFFREPELFPPQDIYAPLHRSPAIRRRRRTQRVDGRTHSTDEQTRPTATDDEDEVSTRDPAGTGEVPETAGLRPLGDDDTVIGEGEDQPWAWNEHSVQRNGQNIVQLLFRVSEDATRRNAYTHRGCQCNSCGMVPIQGIRYRCANCADFDLCEACEAQQAHTKTHVFYKVRVPAPTIGARQQQPVWYPGDPENTRKLLERDVIAKFTKATGFERPEIEAHWEQWTFMATTDWREDPDGVGLAMDRYTFEQCLVPSAGQNRSPPQLIHDRMFAFYDTNKDGLIGFSEFLHGIAFRKKKDKLKKIFDAYDLNEDGYVDRKDFLRIFRAYYALYKELHRDLLEVMDEQAIAGVESARLITGRPPLSGGFGRDGRFPPTVTSRAGEGKIMEDDDLIINDGNGVVSESGNDQGERGSVIVDSVMREHQRRTPPVTWTAVMLAPSAEVRDAYWETMLNPPDGVESLTNDILHTLLNNRQRTNPTAGVRFAFDGEQGEVVATPTEDLAEADQRVANEDAATEDWPPDYITDSDVIAVCGPTVRMMNVPRHRRYSVITHALQRRRDKEIDAQSRAGKQAINDRWQRRQFYTDEEEGAQAPPSYDPQDDSFLQNGVLFDSQPEQFPASPRSRSSSKVRFAEETDEFDTRSNHSASSRSIPERWGGMEISDAERDYGKEILYQVTQQAFNELLDPLFAPLEDAAIATMRSKQAREKWRHLYIAPQFEEWAAEQDRKQDGDRRPANHRADANGKTPSMHERARVNDITDVELEAVRQRPLDDLLAFSGFSLAPEASAETEVGSSAQEDVQHTDVETWDHDPTMPQNKPNSAADEHVQEPFPVLDHDDFESSMAEEEPTAEEMYEYRFYDHTEAEARERGGWARMNFAEFEAAVKGKGNKFDYLGSWIEFCIP